MGQDKNKELLQDIINHFVADKEILTPLQNWVPLHVYLLMLGIEAAKIQNPEFIGIDPMCEPVR